MPTLTAQAPPPLGSPIDAGVSESLGATTLALLLVGTQTAATPCKGGPLLTTGDLRSSAGLEVDLVVERNGALYGIEVKATATPTPQHAESLARWLALTGRNARGVLACRVDAAVPWHLCW